jgi:NADH-quinone oxidoreductase subunit A
VKYYIVGMLFILFDIEIVFMYPWAVIYKKWVSVSSFILVEGLVFMAILLVGYIYAWKKGALEWE